MACDLTVIGTIDNANWLKKLPADQRPYRVLKIDWYIARSRFAPAIVSRYSRSIGGVVCDRFDCSKIEWLRRRSVVNAYAGLHVGKTRDKRELMAG